MDQSQTDRTYDAIGGQLAVLDHWQVHFVHSSTLVVLVCITLLILLFIHIHVMVLLLMLLHGLILLVLGSVHGPFNALEMLVLRVHILLRLLEAILIRQIVQI